MPNDERLSTSNNEPSRKHITDSEADKGVVATPKSSVTNIHDAGSDANETKDGLNATEEMTRHFAEDVPTGANARVEDIPVFDRGDAPPRV
jgi:hypothetical protein